MQELKLKVYPEVAFSDTLLKEAVGKKLMLSPDSLSLFIRRRSLDARKRPVQYELDLLVFHDEQPIVPSSQKPNLQNVRNAEEVVIVGAGPAGLFAALACIENGLKPIVLERGKDVRLRRRDLANLNRTGTVDPDSNYCFGEGGAGTYSDGKLYTRSSKRGDVRQILDWLIFFGAKPEIGIDAHPHIGTNKLPGIIQNIREFILANGGEIHFGTRVLDIVRDSNSITRVVLDKGSAIPCKALILATGHSARDVFHMLHKNEILVEAKPFALGVRAEHPQSIIDFQQYHGQDRGEFLPPASYAFSFQSEGRGFYSFCMCPGGIIAACATDANEVVTNGWSPSKRNNPFANSGVVAEIKLTDLKAQHAFSALDFQSEVEQKAYALGGGALRAPAQRLVDFTQGKVSTSLPECSYQPGIVSVDLRQVLPDFVASSLMQGFLHLKRKMPAYFTNEAVLVATESRTSSPVRIPRDKLTYQHPQIVNLFPCGEGPGYAGGIVSAAMDGVQVAKAVKQYLSE